MSIVDDNEESELFLKNLRYVEKAFDRVVTKSEFQQSHMSKYAVVKTSFEAKSKQHPVFKSSQIFQNYVRPHIALDEKTPAEMAGITVKGEDRWTTLIQNASKQKEKGSTG